MGVTVDEAGGDDVALGIQDLLGGVADAADRYDAPVGDSDVAAETRHAGAVDYRSVSDHQVVLHGRSLGLDRGGRKGSPESGRYYSRPRGAAKEIPTRAAGPAPPRRAA